MRIALDARFISHPQRGGFKSYTVGLLNALLKSLPLANYVWYLDRSFASEVRAANLRTVVVGNPVTGLAMPIREQLQLPKQIEKDGPDVVHFLSNTGPIRCAVPMVLTIHDLLQTSASRLTIRQPRATLIRAYSSYAVKHASRLASMIVTDSKTSRQAIVDCLSIPPDRVRVVYPGIRECFTPEGTTGSLPADLRPGFVMGIASSDPRKNMAGLVAAYSQLPASLQRNAPLVVVCTDQRATSIAEELARTHGSAAMVLTDVDDATLARLYRSASLFVYPSLGEGFGLPPLEAMASGTPVVVSNRGSLPEVVGDAAIAADVSSSALLAVAMRSVLEDEALRVSLIKSGLKRAALFTWADAAAKIREVYQAAMQLEPIGNSS